MTLCEAARRTFGLLRRRRRDDEYERRERDQEKKDDPTGGKRAVASMQRSVEDSFERKNASELRAIRTRLSREKHKTSDPEFDGEISDQLMRLHQSAKRSGARHASFQTYDQAWDLDQKASNLSRLGLGRRDAR